jgi:TolB-like protein
LAESFISELKRRNVFKVGVAYLMLAWVIVQVTSIAVPAIHLPAWVNSLVFLLGLIGFPLALFFAWAFEITPEGVKRESTIPSQSSITSHTGRKLNFIIIGVLFIGMSYFIYESRFATEPPATVSVPANDSVAVLPFVNMSSDPEQEYFSDGISEEILNVLAKIPKLHVTSRSSAFAFKGQAINISEVAKELGVNNVLEGSVRKVGNRIRITAQLIEAGNDKNLWSETYDRELTDIFAIQDEISLAIVTALKAKLGLDLVLASRDMSSVNLDAHNEYLKGRFFVEKRTKKDLEKALEHFDNAIELADDYAPAWMGKAWASLFLSENQYGNTLPDIALSNARPAAEKALQLDPELPEAHAIMGLVEGDDGEEEKAIAYFQTAITLNPNYADAYFWSSLHSGSDGFAHIEKAIQLNPMSIIINNGYGQLLQQTQKFKEAVAVAQHMLEIDSDSFLAYDLLSMISFDEGKLGESLIYQEKAMQLNPIIIKKFEVFAEFWKYGLNQQALGMWKNSDIYEPMQHFLNKEFDKGQLLAREVYPRSEDDDFGSMMRGVYEMASGNYTAGITFLNASSWTLLSGADLLYVAPSYYIIGDTVQLTKIRLKYKLMLGYLTIAGRTDVDVLYAVVAFLGDDIDSAINYLQSALSKDSNAILPIEFTFFSTFKRLRAHPEWTSLLMESDKRVAKVRNDYLKLADKNAILLAREYNTEQTTERAKANVSPDILKDYVGTYVLTPEISAAVTLDDGSLYLEYIHGAHQYKIKVVPESATLFFSLTDRSEFSFQRNDKGQVISLMEHDGKINQKYMKVE